jgi:threonine synthase
MDISKASNFERFVFDLVGRDTAKVRRLFVEELPAKGFFELERDPTFGFVSGKSKHTDRIATIRDTYERFEVMIDPHTADGLKVAREHRQAGVPMVVLETALPVKFTATIVESLGREPSRPAKLQGIEDLPKRVQVLPVDVQTLKAYIATHLD